MMPVDTQKIGCLWVYNVYFCIILYYLYVYIIHCIYTVLHTSYKEERYLWFPEPWLSAISEWCERGSIGDIGTSIWKQTHADSRGLLINIPL